MVLDRALLLFLLPAALPFVACSGGAAAPAPAAGEATQLVPTAAAKVSSRSGFSETGSMKDGRSFHAVLLLPDGRVLAAGGKKTARGHLGQVSDTAELYDPATGEWQMTGTMTQERSAFTMALLPDGRVMAIAGMGSEREGQADVDIWDPATGTWSAAAKVNEAREEYGLVVLKDGRIMVVGGNSSTFSLLASVEIYDPATAGWTKVAPMSAPRLYHTATLLQDGRILVTGGGKTDGPYLKSAEVYNPNTDT
jgi:N-acetylneuraminic acid mutarotase